LASHGQLAPFGVFTGYTSRQQVTGQIGRHTITHEAIFSKCAETLGAQKMKLNLSKIHTIYTQLLTHANAHGLPELKTFEQLSAAEQTWINDGIQNDRHLVQIQNANGILGMYMYCGPEPGSSLIKVIAVPASGFRPIAVTR